MVSPGPAVDYRQRMEACARAIALNPSAIVLPEDRSVHLNGIDMHYLDWGNAHLPHVVLLHGGSLTAHTWDMAALLLRDRYHLVAPDQRGHGDSGWTPEGQLDEDNGDLMAEDTRQFLDYLAFDTFSLVGMSMGGANAMRYAADNPAPLNALVLVDVGAESMRQGQQEMEAFRRDSETLSSFDEFLERARKFSPRRAPEHLAYSLTHSLKQTPEGWTWKQDSRRRAGLENQSEEERRAAAQARAQARWAQLRAIEKPTLLMRGELSKVLAADHAEALVQQMHDARLVVIPGATHNVQGDNPKDFARELDTFLTATLGLPR